jgi:hypothetical protein
MIRDLPKVHDRLNDETLDWPLDEANRYRRYATTDKVDGTVYFDGPILDGWEPVPPH